MRHVLAGLALAAALAMSAAAHAEKRVFVIANDGGGYGVDRCLASGASCGNAVATAYCKSRDFTRAASFHKVDADEITGAVSSSGGQACRGTSCDAFIAIECTR
jgi:hypothetical protein